jgi:hypothetical protein
VGLVQAMKHGFWGTSCAILLWKIFWFAKISRKMLKFSYVLGVRQSCSLSSQWVKQKSVS